MGKYAVRLEDTITAATTIGTVKVSATTPRRLKLLYVEIGISGADASNVYEIAVKRLTAAGAGTPTAVTPAAMDPADAAALFTAAENYTAEPTTYTAEQEMISFAFNQRAGARWTPKPGCEIIVAATASIGLGWYPNVATALTGVVTAHIEEA